MANLTRLDAVPGLWRIKADTNAYLIVRNGRSLLVDCPNEDFRDLLHQAGLPMPEMVLHTQVQAEHCGEWAFFPAAQVFVAETSREIALRSEAFFAACDTVWPDDRGWDYRGEELYGIAGCTTERPPAQPLNVAGAMGETFTWEGVTLEVLPLPGSGKRSIGLYWREAGVVFSGDLLHAGGYLVNFYDLERGYGTPDGYAQLQQSLAAVQALQPSLLLPTTGPVIAEPDGDISALLGRMAWFKSSPRRPGVEPGTPIRSFGRYKEVAPGIYQSNNFGNIILYVDDEGRGLLVDPDPCVWLSWEDSMAAVHADLDLLERETGLKRIELVLITHYHGDHCQFADLLRERYGCVVCATPDVAAVMERPKDFRYPCTVDWYNFPFDHVAVDRRLAYEAPFMWNDIPITPIHTPGHCFAHAGFLIPWKGELTACTGDTLQYGGGAVSAWLPFSYNDTAWPDRGNTVTYRRLLEAKPALILGGHSSFFRDPEGIVLQNMLAVTAEAEALAQAMVPDGDLIGRMAPPGFDALRPPLADAAVAR